MYEFEYNADKNIKLKQDRNISFDEIIGLIQDGYIVESFDNPNKEQYPNQKIYMLDIDGYIWLVPYVRQGNKIFLKTAFPSRKKTKKYFRGKNEKI